MRALALVFLAATFVAPALPAQRVLSPSLDATTLRRGTLRTSLETESILLRGRWADGEAQALGAGLSVPLGPDVVPALANTSDLYALLGLPGVTPSLGTTRTDLRQRLAVTRLGLEYGITDRIALRVQAPFVRVRAEANMALDGAEASAGLNPILAGSGVAAANRAIVDAYASAATALTQRRDACATNPAAFPECATITAELGQVNAAIARGGQYASALATIYGAQGLVPGYRYVPMAGSDLEATLKGVGTDLRTAYQRWGVTNVTPTTGFPLGAQAPITADELGRLLTQPAPDGLGAAALGRSARQTLGDVDVTLRFKILDRVPTDSARAATTRVALRHTVALTYRWGQGHFDLPENLIDLGTGSGHDALGVQAITDVVVHSSFWTTVAVGWARAAEHDRTVRIPSETGNDLIDAGALTAVHIAPADLLELRIAPRWAINDYLGVGGEWRYRTRGADRVTPTVVAGWPTPLAVTIPYGDGGLQQPSDSDEQRWAWTLSYSTIGSHARGRASLPLELFYTHEQSIGSSRGIVPRRWEDRLQLRVYTRLFGR